VDVILKDPMGCLHREWMKLNGSAAKEAAFNDEKWRRILHNFVSRSQLESTCTMVKSTGRQVKCKCFHDTIWVGNAKERFIEGLLSFAKLRKKEQQLQVMEAQKHEMAFKNNFGDQLSRKELSVCYVLPGVIIHCVCRNAYAKLIGFRQNKWETVERFLKCNEEPSHGLEGRQSNNKSKTEDYKEKLDSFFEYITQFANPRATRIVAIRTNNGGIKMDLRDENEELLELPSSFTKRGLYTRFLEENGWKETWDSQGRVIERGPIVESADVACSLPCWPSFHAHWKKYFEHLVIPAAREDVCSECWKFKNKFRYIPRVMNNTVDADFVDGNEEKEEDDDEDDDRATSTNEADGLGMLESEKLIEEASLHVQQAKLQRQLFQTKKELAQSSRHANQPRKDCIKCFVADYAQNLGVPHFGTEQPGETYYYSPFCSYIFGVVDAATKQLTAYTYFEDHAGKGGNNVTSMLWLMLKQKGIVAPPDADDADPLKELNFVFDNCGGQNKNRMVLRFLVVLVKRKICKLARAIFLVRGHTKK
jgi:hypothetical protein